MDIGRACEFKTKAYKLLQSADITLDRLLEEESVYNLDGVEREAFTVMSFFQSIYEALRASAKKADKQLVSVMV